MSDDINYIKMYSQHIELLIPPSNNLSRARTNDTIASSLHHVCEILIYADEKIICVAFYVLIASLIKVSCFIRLVYKHQHFHSQKLFQSFRWWGCRDYIGVPSQQFLANFQGEHPCIYCHSFETLEQSELIVLLLAAMDWGVVSLKQASLSW